MATRIQKPKEPPYDLTTEQLEAQLNDDITELRREAEAYDSGHFGAAGAMAIRMFTMLYDDPKARNPAVSRATRTGQKPVAMPDMSVQRMIDDPLLHGPVCTVAERLIGSRGFVPLLGERHPVTPMVPFAAWWSAPIFRDAIGNVLSRGQIIHTMRDKQIAHADGSLPAAYGAVVYKGMFAVEQYAPEDSAGDANIFGVVVRHAANEVLLALDPAYAGKSCDSQGRLFAPRVLVRLNERREDGYVGGDIQIPKGLPVVVHTTTDDALAHEWLNGNGECALPVGLPEAPDDAIARGSFWTRAALFNINPVPITILGMNLGRDRRSAAVILRVFLKADQSAA